MKKLILPVLTLLFSASTISTFAEEGALSMDFNTDVTTNYLWRGTKSSDLAIQPEISANYEGENFGLSFGVWGTASPLAINNYSELDVFVEFSVGNYTLSLTDYCTPVDNYFDDYKCSHALDIVGQYYFGENLPLTLTWSSILNNETFSHYFEAMYEYSFEKCTVYGLVGCLPFDAEYYGYEDNDFKVTNIGLGISREFSFWNVEDLPLGFNYVYNPDLKENYFNFTVSF